MNDGVSDSYVSKSIQHEITKSTITVKLRKLLISASHMAPQNWQTIFKITITRVFAGGDSDPY